MTKYIGLLVNKKRKANIRVKHPWSETVKNKDMTSGHQIYTPTQVEVKIMTQVIEYTPEPLRKGWLALISGKRTKWH